MTVARMSRPPQHHLASAYDNQVIDFLHVPVSQLGQAYTLPESIYAQAGFPGYPVGRLGLAYDADSSYPTNMPSYPTNTPTDPNNLQAVPSPYPGTQPYPAGQPMESEAVLNQRINSKIDDIIAEQRRQKDLQLHQKIESISSRVDNLHQNLQQNLSSSYFPPLLNTKTLSATPSSSSPEIQLIHSLSAQVQKLSESVDRLDRVDHRDREHHRENHHNRNHEDRRERGDHRERERQESPRSSGTRDTRDTDEHISHKLKKLSKDSAPSASGPSRRVPEW